MPFPDNKFGIWADEENSYIGNKSNKFIIDGNDLIINDEEYKGTDGLWRLLNKPNKNKIDKAFDTLGTKKDNFTEKDLSSYKKSLGKHIPSITTMNHQKTPKYSRGNKWKELVSLIWKEIKPPKSGSAGMKCHKNPIEYKYIDNLKHLQQRLYNIYAQAKSG